MTLVLGAFELDRPVARGGMGEVWCGRHPPTGTPVAVKLLPAERARQPAALRMFRDEVRAIARLHHPNVVEP